MATNSQLTPVNSTILRNKLAKLAVRLQQQADPNGANPDFATLEKVVSESVKVLSEFYQKLSESSFSPSPIAAGTIPDLELYNNNFLSIQDDLEVIFSEFENLEGVTLGSFNYMVSRLNRLSSKLKSVQSQMGDYILLSDFTTRDSIYFSDSFNNLSRIETNTALLTKEQCEINQAEGIVTLPIDRDAQVAINISETPVINSNSNGNVGNNYEAGVALHGTIADILDNNADTWFEYERVVTTDDGEALVLDFTVNLGDPRIVNFIRINPNNFGTRTQIEIIDIQTSLDGKIFTSIKDDIPIAGFLAEDEENVFILAPSTSKFAGQGLYTFTPRKVKFVNCTFRQSTPYVITTSTGSERLRYAIGIRDIDIQALPYKSEGEIISSSFAVGDDVRKVVLLASQNPDPATSSVLASIEHYISPDNGLTWHQLRPKVSAGISNAAQVVPELLDFNGISQSTIQTSSAVQSLRYKAVLKRNPEAFESEASELAEEVDATTELHAPPTTTPFNINLQATPIDNSLKLIDPQFGSRGREETKYSIAVGNGAKLSVMLPWAPLPRDRQKVWNGSVWTLADLAPESVYINGEAWTNGALTGSEKNYRLNYEEGRLEFGDGTNGVAVPTGSVVSMTLGEERLFPKSDSGHIAMLNYPTSNDKKEIEISLVRPPLSTTVLLSKGSTRHTIQPLVTSGTNYGITFSDNYRFANRCSFVDGSVELSATGDYSIDATNGIVYSYEATSTSVDTTMHFFYEPRVRLSEDQWDFADTSNGITNSIKIFDNAFETFEASTLDVPAGVKYFNLEFMSIARGTLSFLDTSTDDTPATLSQEIEYIDGHSELSGVIKASEELAAIEAGVISIPFSMKISNDSSFGVTFSKQDIFQNEVASAGLVDSGSDGDYYIDRTWVTSSTGRIYVKLSSAQSDPGNVTYYYIDPQASLTGCYSVNYDTGEVFTYSATGSNIVADYEYSDYRIKYNIARQIESEDWELDKSSNTIKIKDREILKNTRIPQYLPSAQGSKYYQASYRYVKSMRANVDELEPYFSPILRSYALKVGTKTRLI